MKKFNKSKVIIPALAMIALTTAASATGTVAWFAANSTATAQGLKVNIKSESTFLLIANQVSGETPAAQAASIQAGKLTTVTEEAAAVSLLPSAHDAFTEVADVEAKQNDKYTKWFTGVSADPASPTMTGTKTYIDDGAFATYVKKFTYHFTVALGTNPATDLKVSNLTIAPGDGELNTGNTLSPVKALVVGADGLEEFGYAQDGTAGNVKLFTGSLTDTTTTSVSVYLYYNGEDENLYSNNKAKLEGATVTVKFTCTEKTA
ncbi:hypothetical protein DYE49_00040 [Treponema rectale]|uniref:Uncharacterized protein n=1 Tax=Treponema rectale TaxID=744512 RepID=A0A7M1XHP5_9SPIR|nr:hypothetical protein DYE49_00040 [Treponema rectale]